MLTAGVTSGLFKLLVTQFPHVKTDCYSALSNDTRQEG